MHYIPCTDPARLQKVVPFRLKPISSGGMMSMLNSLSWGVRLSSLHHHLSRCACTRPRLSTYLRLSHLANHALLARAASELTSLAVARLSMFLRSIAVDFNTLR